MRPNNYAAPCKKCGVNVPAGEGYIDRDMAADKWFTSHKPGECQIPARRAAVSPSDSAVDRVIALMTAKFTTLIPELVADNLVKLSRVAEIKVGKAPAVKIETAHNALPDIVTAVVAGVSPFLVGPAGSGKTTLAEQVATVLKRKFYLESRVTSEFKLLGFIDAAGHVVRTQFREAYEHGGVFLLDEVDASDPDALTAFNSALANGLAAFPDALVKRHADFVAIAAGNTYGRGADRQYVGRNQLDAATLDRFCIFEVDYDEMLELELSGDPDWARHVQKVRRAVELEKVRHVVSPRASISGAKLLAAGMDRAKVEESVIWKGLDGAQRSRITHRMGSL
jgi:cobaltochelatase CobS